MIHPKYNYSFDNIFHLVKNFKNMTICLKSNRTCSQNLKSIEIFLSEIQVKHWCIIEWEYITANYDLIVVHPKVIRFA